MKKETKVLISARLPQKTIDKINEVVKDDSSNQSAVLEKAIDRLTESSSDKQLRKLYKISRKATLALQTEKDFEGLNVEKSNIQECLWNLIEYIEAWQKQEGDH
jgi:Arc/MetJ-type ribon-helix-helix transcriptional regulator